MLEWETIDPPDPEPMYVLSDEGREVLGIMQAWMTGATPEGGDEHEDGE